MDSRERFEAFVDSVRAKECDASLTADKYGDGMYCRDIVRRMWQAWQAYEASRQTPHEWIMSRPDGTRMKVAIEDVE